MQRFRDQTAQPQRRAGLVLSLTTELQEREAPLRRNGVCVASSQGVAPVIERVSD